MQKYVDSLKYLKQSDIDAMTQDFQDVYLTGNADALVKKLTDTNMAAYTQDLEAKAKASGEEQRAKALAGVGYAHPATLGVDELLTPMGIRKRSEMPGEWQRPPLPGYSTVTGPFTESIPFGEGTRLRSFIESEIPGIVSQTAKERQAWWERMNPEPEPEEPTFESETTRLKGEIARNQSQAASAPTSEYTGTTYWGEGGAAGQAARNAASAMQRLEALRPEDFTPMVTRANRPFEEDPLVLELRRRNWWARYNRLPGSGLAGSLTPPVRKRY